MHPNHLHLEEFTKNIGGEARSVEAVGFAHRIAGPKGPYLTAVGMSAGEAEAIRNLVFHQNSCFLTAFIWTNLQNIGEGVDLADRVTKLCFISRL